MSGLFAFGNGTIGHVDPVTPADNDPVELIVGTARGSNVHMILVANSDASDHAVTIDRYDGTTAFPLWADKAVPANDAVTLEFEFPVTIGWSLRASIASGGEGHLTVHVTPVDNR